MAKIDPEKLKEGAKYLNAQLENNKYVKGVRKQNELLRQQNEHLIRQLNKKG
jgi:hypothetical protein